MSQPRSAPAVPAKPRTKWIRRGLLILLLLYLAAAVLPYAFPPANVVLPDNWRENAASDRQVDSAVILETGSEALDARLRLIANARQSIRAGSYLFALDDSGTQIASALLAAADRGVKVRLIVDGMIGLINLRADPAAYALGSHPNIEIGFYNPVNLLDPLSLNARYHEKFFVIDDAWLILGGRNISDEFLSQEGNPHYNYDRDILLHRDRDGLSACQLVAEYFDAMWEGDLCRTRYGAVPGRMAASVSAAGEQLQALWQTLSASRDLTPPNLTAFYPVERSLLLSGDTAARPKAPLVYAQMLDLMADAQERVVLESPYFVMDGAMRNGLAQVCSLPAQVTLITNSAASGNNIIASADGVFHRGMTNRLDALVLEQQTDYSMHTKSVLIDDELSIFGSFNVDPRSAYIDMELMLAVYSRPLAAQLEGHMEALAAQSSPVSAQAQAVYPAVAAQPLPFLKAAAIYLLSPLVSLLRYLA